jgi:hypothetical protein
VWTVYTAVYGGKDLLRAPAIPQRAKLVCFSDRPIEDPGPWEVRVEPPAHACPRRSSRTYKLRPDLFFDGPTVWVDANLQIVGDLIWAAESLAGSFWAPRHPGFDCVYEDLAAISRRWPEMADAVAAQKRRCLELGVPERMGFHEANLLIRRDEAWVRDFCEVWAEEYGFGSPRDQPALALARHRTGLGPSFWDVSLRRFNPWIRAWPHLR